MTYRENGCGMRENDFFSDHGFFGSNRNKPLTRCNLREGLCSLVLGSLVTTTISDGFL
ncbi:MAG TPA: hypothetical protein PLN06_11285 [Bacteroidales bacterium]|nr:hypothetical protein [Bacteroidales bacterium]